MYTWRSIKQKGNSRDCKEIHGLCAAHCSIAEVKLHKRTCRSVDMSDVTDKCGVSKLKRHTFMAVRNGKRKGGQGEVVG
jgi:hypothetical protein